MNPRGKLSVLWVDYNPMLNSSSMPSFKLNNSFAFKSLRILLFLVWPVVIFIPFSMPIMLGLLAVNSGICAWSRLTLKDFSKVDIIVIIAIILWGLISSLWSVDAGRSLNVIAGVALLMFAGIILIQSLYVLDSYTRQQLLPSFIHGMFIALGLLTLEVSTAGWLLKHVKPAVNIGEFHKPAVIMVSMVGPLLAYCVQRRWWIAILIIGIDMAFIQTHLNSDAVTGALAVSASCLILFVLYKKTFKMMSFLLIMGCLLSPFIGRYILTPHNFETYLPQVSDAHYYHRLYIWNYTAKRSAERFWTGFGIDASRHPQFKEEVIWQQKTLNDQGIVTSRPIHGYTISMHPHNAFLQWWLELGCTGVILLASVLTITMRRLQYATRNKPRLQQACLRIPPFAVTLIACVSYGIWQNWWLATLLISYAMVVLMNRGLTPCENEGITSDKAFSES